MDMLMEKEGRIGFDEKCLKEITFLCKSCLLLHLLLSLKEKLRNYRRFAFF